MKFASTLLPAFLFALPGQAAPQIEETPDIITLSLGEVEVLVYHKAEWEAPAAAGEVYDRSAFIGPIRNSRGHVVTDTHPPDHWHHMGLWHPWTHTVINGTRTDFWNLKKKEGTVRYVETLDLLEESADGGAGFIVRQDHVMFQPEEKVAVEETLEVILHDSDEPHVIDYVWKQIPKVDMELPPHLYGGGLGFRGRRDWTEGKITVLTSEGKTREDGHATRARWIRYTGLDDSGQNTSVVLMNAPTNHDHPQRMRVHPKEPFFNYAPTQEHPWKLETDVPVSMAYRILIYAGKPTPETLEEQWSAYLAASPAVSQESSEEGS
ncbi:MAG: PmoA family protein [Verrucomicrobiota bacterium JB023]|nr:PmoA family protein [Verrucomicrobiota bacterium JB023]